MNGQAALNSIFCPGCKQSLNRDCFYSKGDRLDTRCKACIKEIKSKKRRAKHAVTPIASNPPIPAATPVIPSSRQVQDWGTIYGKELESHELQDLADNLLSFIQQANRMREQLLDQAQEGIK